jgi:hypothetical protein
MFNLLHVGIVAKWSVDTVVQVAQNMLHAMRFEF